jgi:hypothetical protein
VDNRNKILKILDHLLEITNNHTILSVMIKSNLLKIGKINNRIKMMHFKVCASFEKYLFCSKIII